MSGRSIADKLAGAVVVTLMALGAIMAYEGFTGSDLIEQKPEPVQQQEAPLPEGVVSA